MASFGICPNMILFQINMSPGDLATVSAQECSGGRGRILGRKSKYCKTYLPRLNRVEEYVSPGAWGINPSPAPGVISI